MFGGQALYFMDEVTFIAATREIKGIVRRKKDALINEVDS
jgi:hypothetical protein|tara:strand:- start:466 stop:585 length:120 start_codon:yes stop_codon:yes gene_type:complete